jgi:hypothetical protein
MRIGIDVSQLAYANTGVANYLLNLVTELVKNEENDFVLFYSSLRRLVPEEITKLTAYSNVSLKTIKIPPKALDLMWNRLHKVSVEQFIGPVDLFITSDWTEPPTRQAKKATILYDLIIYKYPQETAEAIKSVQKRKLKWVKKETDVIFCISEATKKDAIELGFDRKKIKVIYPGLTI